MTLRIWGRPNSIHTQRVLWTCAEAELPFELTLASATMGPKGHISNGNAPYGVVDTPEYRAMNPNGTVPTMDDGGFVLWESNVIARYLAQKYAPGPLFGGSLATLGMASQWMEWTGARLEPMLHILVMELVRLTEDRRDAARVAEACGTIRPWLQLLDRHLADRPYVAGAAFTVGDIPPGAAVYRWFCFEQGGPAMPHLEAWQARLSARAGFQRHIAPKGFHLA
ncbi:MAG: glutathione S-transferase family protein [Alphaproteobacteria bacterium]|nr:glutathione S-transferase family protein [Alphaproteobacteria bacterium]